MENKLEYLIWAECASCVCEGNAPPMIAHMLEKVGYIRGELNSAREDILLVLESKFSITLPQEIIDRVNSTTDFDILNKMLINAMLSTSIDEFIRDSEYKPYVTSLEKSAQKTGMLNGKRKTIQTILKKRFNTLKPESVVERINNESDLTQLNRMIKQATIITSIDDFVDWLDHFIAEYQ